MYIASKEISAILGLAAARAERGQATSLFAEGPPGSGKTALAKELAARIGGRVIYYSCAPDRERDLLYAVDVDGVLRRERGWLPGPVWEAFEASQRGERVVVLVDEIDKASPGFDAFLLRLLEEWSFAAPGGETITANPANVAVVLTSNGRRQVRPELLRRCQRVHVPLATGRRHREIITQVGRDLGVDLPAGLVDLLSRIGEALGQRPSPKELAQLGADALELAKASVHDEAIWRSVAASWLVRDHAAGDPAAQIDKVVRHKWWRALRGEAQRGQQ